MKEMRCDENECLKKREHAEGGGRSKMSPEFESRSGDWNSQIAKMPSSSDIAVILIELVRDVGVQGISVAQDVLIDRVDRLGVGLLSALGLGS
eukprot:3208196-Rhodomonas_salina.1